MTWLQNDLKNFGTQIDVRRCMGVSQKLDCDETKMWDSGLSCSTTWMEVTC